MAVLALGAVGAWLAPAGYAALGFSIGSALGQHLFAPDLPTIEGPRLNDLKVQSSSYGEALPIVFGTARLAGKMIWSLPILESRHSEEVSGGKGDGPSQEVVSYTYSQTFAVAICEGEIEGVRRIWANGELIYNVGANADAATVSASNARAASIAIYPGSETQTADATIQSNKGAANTPAYRGTAYVVFTDLQLSKYGNRTPNLEFEVIKVGDSAVSQIATPASVGSDAIFIYQNGVIRVGGPTGSAKNYEEAILDVNGTLIEADRSYTDDDLPNIPHWAPCRNWRGLYLSVSGTYRWQNPIYGSEVVLVGPPTWFTGYVAEGWCVRIGDYLFAALAVSATEGVRLLRYSALDEGSPLASHDFDLQLFTYSGSATANLWPDLFDGSLYLLFRPSSGSATLYQYSIEGGLLDYWNVGTIDSNVGNKFIVDNGIFITFRNSGSGTIRRLNADHTSTSLGANTETASSYCAPGIRGLYWTADAVFNLAGLVPGTESLASIVTDICSQVDIAAAAIDVTDLTDDVDGYVIARRMMARVAIEPLMTAFFFDAVESDGKIKFVTRGGAVAATIAEDDLAAHVDGAEIPDAIKMTRGQEMELPSEVTVSYLDIGKAFQTGTQHSRRLITSSVKALDLQLPIAMTAAHAKKIADVSLYAAWTARNVTPLVTSRAYQHLEPTDLVQATQGNLTWLLRLTSKTERDGLIEWQTVAEDVSVYSQSGDAVDLPDPSLTINIPGPTQLRLLDVPLLRDSDEGYGFYVAISGYLDDWHGANLYKSSDEGASWQLVGGGYLNAAVQGYATTALANFTGGNIFDEHSSVTVVVNGELASITELAVLNGGNAILIGDEVLQYKTATLSAANTYVLTGLLRGRRGTEWAMSTHAIGDRVVALSSTTIYRIASSSAELTLARDYRAVSFDSYLDQSENHEFTNSGIGLECYSPVQIGGGRNAAGDLTINWVRRTRIGGEWRDYVDAQLGEAAESYEVDIYSNSSYTTVLRTITASSQTCSYTAAQQTTDFGSPQATVYLKAYQLSAAVGRGYAATASV